MFTEEHLQAFDSVLRQLKVTGYLCGGTVRDLLLGRSYKDIDVVLSDRVLDAAKLFRAKLDTNYFVLDEDRQVVRVVCNSGNWDLSGFRNHTIEGDLRKRDFTINAMAVRWTDFFPSRNMDAIIDPLSGLQDLKDGMIRSVDQHSLEEDPLRMLRAFRLQAELGFQIGTEVLEQIQLIHQDIAKVATERITEECNRILLQADSSRIWHALGTSPLFDSAFPELKPMKGCEQGGYHHLDVWEHSVLALELLENFFDQLDVLFPDHVSFLSEYLRGTPGSMERKRLLKWSVLLHDLGKPATREVKEPGRWTFHGHDHIGADQALALLKRLKFARKDAQMISQIVDHHLRPLQLLKEEKINKESFYRFFRAAGTEAIGVLLLAYGDLGAASGPLADPDRSSLYVSLMDQMFRYYRDEYYPAVSTPELVKGQDLMTHLQLKPGPVIGRMLKDIREAQLGGKLQTREDALSFSEKWLKDNS